MTNVCNPTSVRVTSTLHGVDLHGMNDDLPDHNRVTHLHMLGQRDDLQRLRITLTTGFLLMYDDWSSRLAHDVFLDALFQVTCLCGIEVGPEDLWSPDLL